MDKGTDFVIIGLSPWYIDIGSNCKSIARELSRHHRVLYINMPLDNKTILRQKDHPEIRKHLDIIKGKSPALCEIQPNLWNYYPTRILRSINWIPSTGLFSAFNKLNNRRFAADIRKATAELGFTNYILFNDNDIFRSFYLKELLRPKLYIYYSRDNLLGVDYWKRHGVTLEPRHIAKADIAVANSHYLTGYLRRHNPNSFYIGQGCDITLFNAKGGYPMPNELENIPHPIIGYIGAINSLRLDENVIREIAASRRDYSIVLVGPEDEYFAKSTLHDVPNIHFLGKRPLSELPWYSSRFDVCINPQLINEVTIGNYPLKIDEYLSMGKPVVATRTRALEIFGDNVYIAEKPADYLTLLDKALSEDNPAKREARIALAHTHTWENSVKELYLAIDKTLVN
ncbi:MAG TPA: glycosyltransferase [Puia sp.]|jgi:glycosyltransferase involved in cell wall biosynthesis|nr:glycosyltransferase [Puia sp.]